MVMGSRPTDERVYVHPGVVSKINRGSVVVSLDKNIHCDSCKAKGACGVSDSATKEVEVRDFEGAFKLDDPVEVILAKHAGHRAVFWAYVFPFILMLLTLVTASLWLPEWAAGLLSLLVLIPYYLIIRGFGEYFRKTFDISIHRI
jgi:sigma-E factor negative regulatory protein RseC